MDNEIKGSTAGFDRIPYFSDAVIAIAITMLALQIELPETTTAATLARDLNDLWPSYLGFFVSFFVIALSWRKHHRMFNYIKRYDKRLIQLNILYLFCVAVFPFTTAVLGRFPNTSIGVILYAGGATALSVSGTLVWLYATYKRRLVDADLPNSIIRKEMISNALVSFVFLVSIAIALHNPAAAMWWWTSLLVLPVALRRFTA